MLHASKTPDESGNYNHSVRVTDRLGISISFFLAQSVDSLVPQKHNCLVFSLGYQSRMDW